MKILNSDDEYVYFVKRNFVYIKDLDHENIIKYKACYLDLQKEKIYIVMDYLPYPNLRACKIKSEDVIYFVNNSVTKKYRIWSDIRVGVYS